MVLFFGNDQTLYAVDAAAPLTHEEIGRLEWLFSGARQVATPTGGWIGPRREMITPWSTNAVEIAQNAGVNGIRRIERFRADAPDAPFDAMLEERYERLDDRCFTVDRAVVPIRTIDDLHAYNRTEGLALSDEEIAYLEQVARRLGRPLTDSEVFGFSQVNSEHCRHKIFNGRFVLDGVEQPRSLFDHIRSTTEAHPGRVVSAYKDNCAFLAGPVTEQFAPASGEGPSDFVRTDFESVIALKAETHNFPTTVEPFNGAATGTGGEIRDRMAGGRGSFPMAGTAVYMTAYPRLDPTHTWEESMPPRPWLYRTPGEILVRASDGASDFGNKFGQPLLCGSLLTFEHEEGGRRYGYDKVVMQAGGVGYGRKAECTKEEPQTGDRVVLLGGDNYRIGMGGGAVSSVATGEYRAEVELNAVQRSNPEMQKRAFNAIRALAEEEHNPIRSIHDHGAGGHLNCLSELVEGSGGRIRLDRLPVGDPTLSAREIVGNESQERMGLLVDEASLEHVRRVAERECAPFYAIGEATGDGRFTFVDERTGERPIDWPLEDMFGRPPRTVMHDGHRASMPAPVEVRSSNLIPYIERVLSLESVACKDWLTNKVDRSVTGRVALQQTAGRVQLPLNDCAIVALDYAGRAGIATSIGHAPAAALIDAAEGSRLAMAEALTNLALAPLRYGLEGVSLSANWMWPCRREGEDARLYDAVQAAGEFARALGLNIPTGKDSLSMTQKYPDGRTVDAPGTVIISAAGEVDDIARRVEAALVEQVSQIVYVDMARSPWELGGSALAQTLSRVGDRTPAVADPAYFARAFAAVQRLVHEGQIWAGHDISAGGLIVALLEMTFADNRTGLTLDLDPLGQSDLVRLLFAERPALVLQTPQGDTTVAALRQAGVQAHVVGSVNLDRRFEVRAAGVEFALLQNHLRDLWFRPSYLLDRLQRHPEQATERYMRFAEQELAFRFPVGFRGTARACGIDPDRRRPSGIRAAIIRDKGSNGDREMAWAMYLAGMDVRDVHMTDLREGRETLDDVNLIVFTGGFSNSDVLGSARGWAAAFRYNDRARRALERYYAREDTLSLGVCNGCQLMMELRLLAPGATRHPRMLPNASGRFESAFLAVEVPADTGAVMLRSLAGSRLGIWVAHAEGRFDLPGGEQPYRTALRFAIDAYPANPNGSPDATAGLVSADGRHLAVMPHLERSIRPWHWGHYPYERRNEEVTPWILAFTDARRWIEQHRRG